MRRDQEVNLYLISHRVILHFEAVLIYIGRDISDVSFERGKLIIGQCINSSTPCGKLCHAL
jgi:hypothetical protein